MRGRAPDRYSDDGEASPSLPSREPREFYAELREIVRHELGCELDERRSIEAETHAHQHAWLAARIEREQARAQFFRKALEIVMQWSIPAVLTYLAAKVLGMKFPGLGG
jgi:hypothetical protein